ncbi:MAG: hypothetical protein GWN71_44315, partial [Gammaproteobacteria bacterium]|nr:hypothetical protein [Gammaproteobacteria bacterium]
MTRVLRDPSRRAALVTALVLIRTVAASPLAGQTRPDEAPPSPGMLSPPPVTRELRGVWV